MSNGFNGPNEEFARLEAPFPTKQQVYAEWWQQAKAVSNVKHVRA